MFALQPVLVAVSLAGALAASLAFRGVRATLRGLRWQLPAMGVICLVNPLFSASGSTELWRLGSVVIYLESLAFGACMPNAKIQAAIDKAFGAGAEAVIYKEVTYEGYGPAGVAVYVECLTDNINRTAADVRSTFSHSGGNLGTTGSVAFQFTRKGSIAVDKIIVSDEKKVPDRKNAVDEDEFMGGAIRHGNVGVLSEFNVAVDPVAAREVVEAGFDVTFVPLEVADKALVMGITGSQRSVSTYLFRLPGAMMVLASKTSFRAFLASRLIRNAGDPGLHSRSSASPLVSATAS